VVCIQNHDQIGNRLLGERLGAIVGFEQQKLAAGLLCLSPSVPLLFMGEEYGDPAPFQYFISHGDPELVEAVRRGRRDEFAAFGWHEHPPDPAGQETFDRCVLKPELRGTGQHAVLYALYERLLELRARLAPAEPDECTAFEARRVLFVRRGERAWIAFCLSAERTQVTLQVPRGTWHRLSCSADAAWEGPGDSAARVIESAGEVEVVLEPYSFIIYGRAGWLGSDES
jgi:maltooligosyltrehalose trehalohydrolase